MPPPLPTRPVQHRVASLAPARRPRLLALGAIVLLHVAGLWWLRSDLWERPRPARREAARVTLRVLPLPSLSPLPAPPRSPTERRLQTPQPPTSAARPAPADFTPRTPPSFEAITAAPAPPTAPGAPAEASTPPRPATAALDLRLPHAASAPPTPAGLARSDPRSNTAGARSFGERLGSALGSDDRIVEEAMNDGRMRIRRGASCVEVHQARSAQLDPYNEAARTTPRSAKACD